MNQIPKKPIQLELYSQFVANKSRLESHEWLTSFLAPHCRIKHTGWRGSRLRLIQVPSEWAAFLVMLPSRNVRSYLEIGTSSGGSFYCADSYLRAAVPQFKRSVGYDLKKKMRSLDKYIAAYPLTEFRYESSRSMNLGCERFDVAFIDARHSEKWVLQDFEKVRGNCRLVAFHDIVRGSVPKAWNKIKSGRTYWEFIDRTIPVEAQCGIGVVEI